LHPEVPPDAVGQYVGVRHCPDCTALAECLAPAAHSCCWLVVRKPLAAHSCASSDCALALAPGGRAC
jgi:hypothetical protein